MPTLDLNSLVTGKVIGMAFGGEGIIRHEGFVIFVPFTAPGDLITCRITKKKKSFAHAALVEVLEPSEQRTEPFCPYFGRCGGCQLQHLKYDAQLEYKRQDVQDALVRIGRLPIDIPPVIGSKQERAYRRHITLKLKPFQGYFEAGYIAVDNVSLVKVMECQIFVESSEAIIKEVQKVAKTLASTPRNEGKATIFKLNEHNYLLHFHFTSLPSNGALMIEKALNKFKNWSGVLLTSPKKILRFGAVEASFSIDRLSIAFSPLAFVQNHPEQSANIYKEICRIAKASAALKVLDLYCGIGILSLLLASQGHIVKGIEFNEEAILLAKHNAKTNHISNVSFTQGDVSTALSDVLNSFAPDLIIVNPPRTGLDLSVTQLLSSNCAKEILYISCMPSTLSRDLAMLCTGNYDLEYCQSFDMFPQTGHVETVAKLKKRQI